MPQRSMLCITTLVRILSGVATIADAAICYFAQIAVGLKYTRLISPNKSLDARAKTGRILTFIPATAAQWIASIIAADGWASLGRSTNDFPEYGRFRPAVPGGQAARRPNRAGLRIATVLIARASS